MDHTHQQDSSIFLFSILQEVFYLKLLIHFQLYCILCCQISLIFHIFQFINYMFNLKVRFSKNLVSIITKFITCDNISIQSFIVNYLVALSIVISFAPAAKNPLKYYQSLIIINTNLLSILQHNLIRSKFYLPNFYLKQPHLFRLFFKLFQQVYSFINYKN